jgi:hypothetical protein
MLIIKTLALFLSLKMDEFKYEKLFRLDAYLDEEDIEWFKD